MDEADAMSEGGAPPGWPFFAPASTDGVTNALDLAQLRPGDHLVDLGSGDGQVLVAAAERGAWVTGVESDQTLAAQACRALIDAGLEDRGRVLVADLLDDATWAALLWPPAPARPPDVVFGYLSPALLQRLTPRLRNQPGRGTRLVTVDFEVPDLRADAARGGARLYRLPGRRRPSRPGAVGWSGGTATLCVMPPEVSSLSCLRAVHCGGPVRLSVAGRLARYATVITGTDGTEAGRPVAVDIRWRECPAGTLAHGEVDIDGLPPHEVFVLFAEDDQGQWDLSTDGRRALSFRLRRRSLPRPTTAAELLTAARG